MKSVREFALFPPAREEETCYEIGAGDLKSRFRAGLLAGLDDPQIAELRPAIGVGGAAVARKPHAAAAHALGQRDLADRDPVAARLVRAGHLGARPGEAE